MNKYISYNRTLYKSTLPDPEHHPFFMEVEVEEVRKSRIVNWLARWLRGKSADNTN